MALSLVRNYPRNESCPDLKFCLKDDYCWDTQFFSSSSSIPSNTMIDFNGDYMTIATASSSNGNGGNSTTGQCFRFSFSLFIVGVVLVSIAEVQGRKKQFKKFKRTILKATQAIGDTFDDLSLSFRRTGSSFGGGGGGGTTTGSFLSESSPSDDYDDDDDEHDEDDVFGTSGDDVGLDNDDKGGFEGSLDDDGVDENGLTEEERLHLAFILTPRSTTNFTKNHMDDTLTLPRDYPPEYKPHAVDNTVLPASGFFFAETWDLAIGCNLIISVYLGSAGWAMICSAFSSLLWILVDYERECVLDTHYIEDWIHDVGNSLTQVRDEYDFYPVFLLIGYIGYVVERWRAFMVNCHECQAKMHDVCLLCGGCTIGPPSKEVRKKLYRIYRYINAVHALCYKSVSPSVGPLELEYDFILSLKLLDVDEAEELKLMGNKKRDAVIGWITCEIAELLQMEGVQSSFVEDRLARAIAEVRLLVARHHDLFIRDNPNFYLDLMLLVVNALLFLVIISYPFSLVVYAHRDVMVMPCFQPIVMIGVFVVVASYRTAFSLLSRLRNPFSWTRDRIKIDSLLASTDKTSFVLLRTNFKSQQQYARSKSSGNDPTGNRRRWINNRLQEKKMQARQAAAAAAEAAGDGSGGDSSGNGGRRRALLRRNSSFRGGIEAY